MLWRWLQHDRMCVGSGGTNAEGKGNAVRVVPTVRIWTEFVVVGSARLEVGLCRMGRSS